MNDRQALRYEQTVEALADVDAGRFTDQEEVEGWVDMLVNDYSKPPRSREEVD